jgi:prefoldin subunit 5
MENNALDRLDKEIDKLKSIIAKLKAKNRRLKHIINKDIDSRKYIPLKEI